MHQEYFLVSKLSGQEANSIPQFPWMIQARRRSALISTLDLNGACTIYNQHIIAPGPFSYRGYRSNIVVSIFYPEEVTSPVRKIADCCDSTQLSVLLPGYCPGVPKPPTTMPPDAGRILYAVNAISKVLPVRVDCRREEPVEAFRENLATWVIDVDSGIPASLLYTEEGRMAGIAITSIYDGKILVLPSYVLAAVYSKFEDWIAKGVKMV